MCCRQFSIFVIIMVQFKLAQLIEPLSIKDIALDWSKSHPDIELPQPLINGPCLKYGACDSVEYIQDNVMEFFKVLLNELSKKNVTAFVIEIPQDDKHMYNLCVKNTKLIYPYAARAENEKWYYILNTESHRFQGFRTQMCEFNCSQDAFVLNGTYKMRFFQRRIYKKMVYLDLENKKLDTNYFEIPSCCSIELVES